MNNFGCYICYSLRLNIPNPATAWPLFFTLRTRHIHPMHYCIIKVWHLDIKMGFIQPRLQLWLSVALIKLFANKLTYVGMHPKLSVQHNGSPYAIFFFAILYVLIENVRMLRGLATLYGGRPGLLGALRLGRMVITHIIATGGVAMTDDLLGQFLGQDLVRRLSRRLGEGVFNGALTARIGAAAVEV